MSEERQEVGVSSDGSAGSEAAGPAQAAVRAGGEMFNLLTTAAGWFVVGMGFLTILTGLHYQEHLPITVTVALLLMGASYVLAGQGLANGYAWAVPLGALSCVFNPFGIYLGFMLLAALGCFRLTGSFPKGTMNVVVGPRARLAYGLWLGGLLLLLYAIIMQRG